MRISATVWPVCRPTGYRSLLSGQSLKATFIKCAAQDSKMAQKETGAAARKSPSSFHSWTFSVPVSVPKCSGCFGSVILYSFSVQAQQQNQSSIWQHQRHSEWSRGGSIEAGNTFMWMFPKWLHYDDIIVLLEQWAVLWGKPRLEALLLL